MLLKDVFYVLEAMRFHRPIVELKTVEVKK